MCALANLPGRDWNPTQENTTSDWLDAAIESLTSAGLKVVMGTPHRHATQMAD
jgi:hypothetical protein